MLESSQLKQNTRLPWPVWVFAGRRLSHGCDGRAVAFGTYMTILLITRETVKTALQLFKICSTIILSSATIVSIDGLNEKDEPQLPLVYLFRSALLY